MLSEEVDELSETDAEFDGVPGLVVEPGTYSDADGVEVMTGGRLDSDGISTVLNSGFEVKVGAVASGPIVTGTLKMAQIWAMTAKVSDKR